ncbi:UNVERIFIED_ORG: hypothetical protein ABIB52_004506 [Arthrobacter sp. UYCu721]
MTRSPEAKALGIPMGEPWFKLAPLAKEWGLIAKSSNYELYGDISARVMELLGRYSAWLEVYIMYPKMCCCGLLRFSFQAAPPPCEGKSRVLTLVPIVER